MGGSTRLSVLIFTPEYPPDLIGGLGTHVCELARGLASSGHQVHVVITTLLGNAAGGEAMDDGFDVRLHHAPVVGKSRANDAAACALEIVRRYGPPDIVHCHDHFFVAAAQRLRRSCGATVIGTVHLLPDAIVPLTGGVPGAAVFERVFCTNVDRLIAVSAAMRQLCHDAHGVPLDRIDVVHNGFDARAFVATPGADELRHLRAELGADGHRLVLFAGRLCWQKGLDGFFAAAELVLAQRDDVRYAIAGEVQPGYDDTWSGLLERHSGVRSRLQLLGLIPRDRLARLYHVVDLAVVPSLYEPFGYAAVEPLAAGCPVVATNVGGLPEIFGYPGSPPLVEVDTSRRPYRVDAAMLAAAQLEVLDHPDRARATADAGQRHVLATFTVERMVDQTVRVYREAIAARAPSGRA